MPAEIGIPMYLTEMVHPNDLRASIPNMTDAIEMEAKEVLDRIAFNVVVKKTAHQDANILPRRFVLATECTGDTKSILRLDS